MSSRPNLYGEPWRLDRSAVCDADGDVLGIGTLPRAVLCVNVCAGFPDELLAQPAFRAMLELAADSLGADQPSDLLRDAFRAAEERIEAAMENALALRMETMIDQIDGIVASMLRKHGVLPEASAPTELKHIHTLSCYDDAGELSCQGGAR